MVWRISKSGRRSVRGAGAGQGAALDDAEGDAAVRGADVGLDFLEDSRVVADAVAGHAHGGGAVDDDGDVARGAAAEAAEAEPPFERDRAADEQRGGEGGGEQGEAPAPVRPQREGGAERGHRHEDERQHDGPRDAGLRLDEGARERERGQRDDETAADEQQRLLEQEAPPPLHERIAQELERAPVEGARRSAVEQVEQDRHRDSRQTRQHQGDNEFHGKSFGFSPGPCAGASGRRRGPGRTAWRCSWRRSPRRCGRSRS